MKPSVPIVVVGLLVLLGSVLFCGWVALKALVRSEEPFKLGAKWAATALMIFILYKVLPLGMVGLQIGLVLGIILCILWAPQFGALISKPLTSFYDGGGRELEAQPLYSIAEARRKQGRYAEAITGIQMQLEKFPGDFTGWIMLAEIQAENLKDLAGAQETIERILNQRGHPPKHVAYALSRLADWHLKLAQDRESARSALERIVQLLPETEQAQLARQRLAHLMPDEMIQDKQEPHRIPVQHHEENLGLRRDFKGLKRPAEPTPSAIAADYVKHLAAYPHDYEAREKLALIYAEHFRRLDLATDQLEQLIAVPHQPSKLVVRWLNLLADLQVRLTSDASLARTSLQRIVDRFPKTAAAENALHRMAYLNLELKSTQNSPSMKLGDYERDAGLNGRTT